MRTPFISQVAIALYLAHHSASSAEFCSAYLTLFTSSTKNSEEPNFLTANISSKSRVLPKAFTEKGLYMLATVLKSRRATEAQGIGRMETRLPAALTCDRSGQAETQFQSGCCPSCAFHAHSVIFMSVKTAVNEESSGEQA